ncbi:MAG: DUF5309 domain-containing protein [Reyranella sp.]|uniref:SU10 major capsid protein n=1 Tax=Reyranella sp. TaxID=1929291 RepID=UPI0025EE5F72|nr:DUF5309 family protein [Reyranella sp.]MBR2818217.1 DUF5309 domain-containing protein [Reyranella sp.]
MGLVTNTVTTYASSKSIREDLSNIIYNIDPTDTPLMSNIKRDTSNQPHFEWQTDGLAVPNTNNAVIEGDDAPAVDTYVPTNKVGNYTQISRKTVMVSGSDEKAKMAGIKSMLGYRISQASKELKRDMEATLTSDQVAVVGNNSTARRTAALGSWIITNWYQVATSGSPAAPQMSSGSDGYPSTAAVDGTTPVAFAVSHLKNMIQKVYTAGGDIPGSFVMVGPHNKTVVSSFNGIATPFRDVPAGKQAQIIGAADVYVSDFGTFNIVPNRFQPENRAYMVDPSMLAVTYFRPFEVVPLAKTGDATKRMLIVEYGLRSKNEKGLGTVRGLATS